MTGRIGDVITDAVLERCEGCAQSTLMCEVQMDHDHERCCGVCTHLHHPDLLARYGLFNT